MGPEITLRPEAANDLVDQVDYYIQQKTPDTAVRWVVQTQKTFEFLGKQPGIGARCRSRKHALASLRRWPVEGFENFYVYYVLTDDGIDVVRILSGYRDFKRFF